MSSLLLVLRHNMTVDNDVSLAQSEAAALCSVQADSVRSINDGTSLKEWLVERLATSDGVEHRFVCTGGKRHGTCAFVLEDANWTQYQKIVERAAFFQEVLFIADSPQPSVSRLIQRISRSRTLLSGVIARAIPLSALLEYSAYLVFNRESIGSVSAALDAIVEMLLDEVPPPSHIKETLQNAIRAKKTTLYLSHELHLYKGKFFPRLVHSLINRFAPPDHGVVCGPFAGSGTALLESSLLGYQAIGLDVDPTSVLISKHKTFLTSVDSDELLHVSAAMDAAVRTQQKVLFQTPLSYDATAWASALIPVPEPMRSRLQKRGQEEGYDLLGEIERDAATALLLIGQAPEHLRSIFRVCLSHALTKKLRLRFVGIGNGRFTFDVAKVRVLDLFIKKTRHVAAIAEGFDWLRRCGVSLGKVTVERGSARDLDQFCAPQSLDLVITSPPYIPASSGREHYARARAIPLVLTGASTVEELDDLDRSFIGEMHADAPEDSDQQMPPSVSETLSFLQNDEQRRPKYVPTRLYYQDVREVLRRIESALKADGVALVVVAKSHTFYVHKTKKIVHTVAADSAICELGNQVGLDVEKVIDVPLHKSGGLNARPRSTDEYSEAVVVFRRKSRHFYSMATSSTRTELTEAK
jgi:hypothetical protein